MKSNIEVDSIDGPASWASYLVNGDDSGLEPNEKAACDAFVRKLARKGWYVVSVMEDWEGIMRWDGLLTEVVRYTIHRKVSK